MWRLNHGDSSNLALDLCPGPLTVPPGAPFVYVEILSSQCSPEMISLCL